MQTKFPQIGDVRGLGAMMAIEFVKNSDPRQPDGDLCGKVVKGCADRNLIIISAGTYKNNIRILSPLTISNDLLNEGLDIIEDEIGKAVKS
jgi:4-aminobutyrate aminotransferase/(S)-3-amino-2-methylpropionate transaminase